MNTNVQIPNNIKMDNIVLYKAPSKIHGFGLFSKIPYMTGQTVTEFFGKEITEDVFNGDYNKVYKCGRNFYMPDTPQLLLLANEEPYLSHNMINYCNHSDKPNCMLRKRKLIALQSIPKDTELTIKYHKWHPLFQNNTS